MTPNDRQTLSKVPAVTLGFWILKVLATTLGETGGDAVTMSMDLGYLVGTAIFGVVFAIAVAAQIAAKRFHPLLYWLTIIATTTVGTTLADFADRSLRIGYAGGSAALLALLVASLVVWKRSTGSLSVENVVTARDEAFYWVTIMFSQTLGTALGDWSADDAGLGFGGATLVYGSLLAIIAALYRWTRISHVALFWAAFILTRPLGAVVGDLLDKPHDEGGLALSRYAASAVLLVLMGIGLVVFPQKAASRAGSAAGS